MGSLQAAIRLHQDNDALTHCNSDDQKAVHPLKGQGLAGTLILGRKSDSSGPSASDLETVVVEVDAKYCDCILSVHFALEAAILKPDFTSLTLRMACRTFT